MCIGPDFYNLSMLMIPSLGIHKKYMNFFPINYQASQIFLVFWIIDNPRLC